MNRVYFYLLLTIAVALPALVLRLADVHPPSVIGIIIFGGGIVAAAFILCWAVEVAQVDISQSLAVVLLALIAVLPEYAVDLYFAWTAASDPTYAQYALANMTGANRLLIGLGWPLLVFVYLWKFKKREIKLEPRRSIDLFWLAAATLYCFLIPIKGRLDVWDTVILFALFGMYTYRASKVALEKPELEGLPAAIAKLPAFWRKLCTTALFLFSGAIILASAKPFAESLISSGKVIGIDEFFLVQWLAPLASESPEIVVTVLLVLRGLPSMGLGGLVSAKVNQWSLLVGAVPLVYLLGSVYSQGVPVWHMHLDARQIEEVLLTAAQSFYALSVILNFRFSLKEASILAFLFFSQLIATIVLEEMGLHSAVAILHYSYSALYILLGLSLIFSQLGCLKPIMENAWKTEWEADGKTSCPDVPSDK